MDYDTLFVNPNGRTARGAYLGALGALLAAAGFYYFLVPGLLGRIALLVLVCPAVVLHARRLHDMARPGWLALVPGALLVAAGWFNLGDPEAGATGPVTVVALVVATGFVLWSAIGGSGGDEAAPAAT